MNNMWIACGQQSVDALAQPELGLDTMQSPQVLNYDDVQNNIRNLEAQLDALKAALCERTKNQNRSIPLSTGTATEGPRAGTGQLALTDQSGKLSHWVDEGGTRGEKTPLSQPKVIHRLSTSTKIPPDIEDVIQYAAELGMPPDEAHNFYDYWETWGWQRKYAGPMRCWRGSLRTWSRRYKEKNPSGLQRPKNPLNDPNYRKLVQSVHRELHNDPRD